jgi:hypothetical protein
MIRDKRGPLVPIEGTDQRRKKVKSIVYLERASELRPVAGEIQEHTVTTHLRAPSNDGQAIKKRWTNMTSHYHHHITNRECMEIKVVPTASSPGRRLVHYYRSMSRGLDKSGE